MLFEYAELVIQFLGFTQPRVQESAQSFGISQSLESGDLTVPFVHEGAQVGHSLSTLKLKEIVQREHLKGLGVTREFVIN